MVIIEQDGLRVEAETLRKAQRALRKAQLAEREAQAQRSRAMSLAYDAALANLARIAVCAADGNTRRMGETLTDAQRCARVRADGERWHVRIDGTGVAGTLTFWAGEFASCSAVWERMNGETVAVELVRAETQAHEIYAVGSVDGIASLARVPDYVIERMLSAEAVR